MRWRHVAYLADLWQRFTRVLTVRTATAIQDGLQEGPQSALKVYKARKQVDKIRRQVVITEKMRGINQSAASSFNKLRRMSLAEVQHHLGLAENGRVGRRDPPVFISLDFEYASGTLRAHEMGLAILDAHAYRLKDVSGNMIRCLHYNIDSSSARFAFGPVRRVTLDEAGRLLDQALQQSAALSMQNDAASGKAPTRRDIVLVGHGLRTDYHVARQLGAKLRGVKAYFDTSRTEEVLNGEITPKLIALLEVLGIRDMKRSATLHNAGNDAAFTLLAMIALARQELVSPLMVRRDLLRHREMHPTGNSQGQWLASQKGQQPPLIPVTTPVEDISSYRLQEAPHCKPSSTVFASIEQRRQDAGLISKTQESEQQESLSQLLLQVQQRKQAGVVAGRRIAAKQAADLAQLAIPREAEHLRHPAHPASILDIKPQ